MSESVVFKSLGVSIEGTLSIPIKSEGCPAVIFCHGAGDSKKDFASLAEYLCSNGYATLCIDMHGHGDSEGDRYAVRMSEWSADVRGAIDFLQSDPRIQGDKIGAMGLSSGGTAILETAIIDDRLKSLIALDATVRDSLPLMTSLVFRLLCILGAVKKLFTRSDLRVSLSKFGSDMQIVSDPELNKEIISNPELSDAYKHFPLPGAKESFIVNTIKRVGCIKAPTLVIWGAEDRIDPPTTANALFNALRCEKDLQIIEGNGHAGHLDRNKDEVYKIALAWLNKTLS